jgi:hypothetical protein
VRTEQWLILLSFYRHHPPRAKCAPLAITKAKKKPKPKENVNSPTKYYNCSDVLVSHQVSTALDYLTALNS